MDQRPNIECQKQKAMNRVVPFEKNFKTVGRLSKTSSIILYISAFVSIAILLISSLEIEIEWLNGLLNPALAVMSVLYFIIDILQRFLFHNGETHRKNDLMDNALGTRLTEEKSEGYFTNDNLEDGLFKLGVDTFENSFYTKSISGSMIKRQLIISIIIVMLFVLVITLVPNSIIIQVLLLALPYAIISDTIRLWILHVDTKKVFEDFKLVFTSVEASHKDYLLINCIVSYEKSLSWAAIKLDSKKFHSHNDRLAEKWKTIKIEHNIA